MASIIKKYKLNTVKTIIKNSESVTDALNNFNLISVDSGDGEDSAKQYNYYETRNTVSIEDIYLEERRNNITSLKKMNIINFKDNDINKECTLGEINKDKKIINFSNFKRIPTIDEEIPEKYRNVNNDIINENITYEILMKKSFKTLVRLIFECNESLKNKENTIIMVGRPSSQEWADREQAYAKLLQTAADEATEELKNNKKIHEKGKIHIVVQSEALAVFARQIDEIKRLATPYTVLIIDNGSSTVDITVITQNGIVGECSFNFGGNKLDRIICQSLYKKLNDKIKKDDILFSESTVKLFCREKKEKYYTNLNEDNPEVLGLRIPLKNQSSIDCMFDDAFMTEVTEKIPTEYNNIPAISWLSAYDQILKTVKNQYLGENNTPTKIYLSGGVSVMPCVQKKIKDIFDVNIELISDYNYAVSVGLAYVLGTEIRKEFYLNKIMEDIRKQFVSADILKELYLDLLWKNFYKELKKVMTEWLNNDTDLDDLNNNLKVSEINLNDTAFFSKYLSENTDFWKPFNKQINEKMQDFLINNNNTFNYTYDNNISLNYNNVTYQTDTTDIWKFLSAHITIYNQKQKIDQTKKEKALSHINDPNALGTKDNFIQNISEHINTDNLETFRKEILDSIEDQISEYISSKTLYMLEHTPTV